MVVDENAVLPPWPVRPLPTSATASENSNNTTPPSK
jgi:hypothetical protein